VLNLRTFIVFSFPIILMAPVTGFAQNPPQPFTGIPGVGRTPSMISIPNGPVRNVDQDDVLELRRNCRLTNRFLPCTAECFDRVIDCHIAAGNETYLKSCYNVCQANSNSVDCMAECVDLFGREPSFYHCSMIGAECNIKCFRVWCAR
jgi:hypothetical protein